MSLLTTPLLHAAAFLALLIPLAWLIRRDAVRSYRRTHVEPLIGQCREACEIYCKELGDRGREIKRLRQNVLLLAKVADRSNLRLRTLLEQQTQTALRLLKERNETAERLSVMTSNANEMARCCQEYRGALDCAIDERSQIAQELLKLKAKKK